MRVQFRPRGRGPKASFSADETTDIGNETGTTVSPDYIAHISRFTGTINWVQIDLGDDATITSIPTNASEWLWHAISRIAEPTGSQGSE